MVAQARTYPPIAVAVEPHTRMLQLLEDVSAQVGVGVGQADTGDGNTTNEVIAISNYSRRSDRPVSMHPRSGGAPAWTDLPDDVPVMIVATWPTMRMGLRMLIEAAPGFHVVAEAGAGIGAGAGTAAGAGFDLLAAATEAEPELVVIDVDPERIADTRRLLAHTPDAAVLLLMDGPEGLPDLLGPHQPLPERATAVLLRDSTAGEIHAALQAALAGMVVLDPAFVAALPTRFEHDGPADSDVDARNASGSRAQSDLNADAGSDTDSDDDLRDVLTERERQVLHLVALGMPNKGIAAELGISEHTAKFHVGAILAKLSAASRAEAVAIAARRGLLSL